MSVRLKCVVDAVALTCSSLPPQDTGLYYDRYLREVIEVLETDPHFREKLQTANTEDIKVFTRTPLSAGEGGGEVNRCCVFCWGPERTSG